jgi:hypothetical protein
MRLDMLDETTRCFVLALLPPEQGNARRRKRNSNSLAEAGVAEARRRRRPVISAARRHIPSAPDFASLADELIGKPAQPLGAVYEFLLRTHRAPENARADFVKFLSGQLSKEWLDAARRAIAEERRTENGTQLPLRAGV